MHNNSNNRPSHQNPNPNPKIVMASHFLQSFARINSPSFPQRSRSIRRAAYSSMARAAGGGRAWSRALIHRLRRPGSTNPRRFVMPQRRIRVSWQREPDQVEALRRLVPGGKAMDLCDLLEETASYVQFLAAQVTLMQRVAESLEEQD